MENSARQPAAADPGMRSGTAFRNWRHVSSYGMMPRVRNISATCRPPITRWRATLLELPGKFHARLCSRVTSPAQWTVNKLLAMGASGRPCNKQAALCSMFVKAPYLQALPLLREVWRDADSASCCSRKTPSPLSRQTKRVSLSSAFVEVAQLASIAPDTDMHTESCRARAARHPYATLARLKHQKELMRAQCCSFCEP